MSFASDTAVHADGDGRYATEIRPGWDIGGNPNGGYLITLALRAMRDASERPDVLTATGHFLAPGQPGPATVTTEVVKRGRTLATVSGSLEAGGKRTVQVLAAFADLSTPAGPERVEAEPPELPPVDACIPVDPADGFAPPFMQRIDLRLHPDDAGFSRGAPSGEPRVRGWFRLRDDEPIDSLALVLATDAFPPTAFNGRSCRCAWVPTVELTSHVHAARARMVALRLHDALRHGRLPRRGRRDLGHATDRIVAQSRQLALVPRG